MEAIKCPNCGSEKVKELTEEKYVCLACDNVFLVHNLSKEFRETDIHISQVHQDISQKLDEIKVVSGDNNAEIQECLFQAEESLEQGDDLQAYKDFKKYSMIKPESSIGYEGMYRAIRSDFMEDAGEYEVIDDSTTMDNIFYGLHDGFDVLKKAMECEDCQKDNLLSKTLEFYKKSAHTLLSRMVSYQLYEDSEAIKKSKDNVSEEIKTVTMIYQEDIEKAENLMAQSRNKIDTIKNTPKSTAGTIKKTVPLLILLILFLLSSGFLKIVFIIAMVIAAFIIFRNKEEVELQFIKNCQQEIESKQKNIDFLKEASAKLNEIKALQIDDMEHIICNEWNKGQSAEEFYQQYKAAVQRKIEEQQEEERRQAELLEGYYCIELTNWGSDPKRVRDILLEYCSSPQWVKEQYKNRAVCRVNNFRKTRAYELQDKLIKSGAFVNVHQM